MDEKKKRELAKLISKLKNIRGAGTELISVYIPSGYAIPEITNKLRQEYGQAANIKSKTTKKNVRGALERIIQYLKIFKGTPEKGLAIFCGNISKDLSKVDIELFSISPPEPVQVQIYRCDSQFLLEPLETAGERKEKYGLVAIDGKEATIAILEGNISRIIRRLRSFGPSKTHKGGSSAARYQRFVEEKTEDYYKRVGEAMDETLFASDIKNVIIGGPGPVKEDFIKTKAFNYQFNIIGTIDIGYTDEYGIEELKKRAIDVIAEEKSVREKQIVERFMKEIVKEGLATYGVKEVMGALETGKVEILLLSEKLPLKKSKVRCESGHEDEIIAEEGKEHKCKICSSPSQVVEEADLFDILYDMAEEKGAKVEMISADTTDGAQFLAGFKGIGAILKYK